LDHCSVSAICHGKNMRRNFVSAFTSIVLNHFLSVNGDLFVGIDNNTEKPGVCLGKREALH
jgi:hypothetical protein